MKITDKTPISVRKIRDLNLIEFEDDAIIIACDSTGAVGALKKDESYRAPEVCGFMYPKCILMELLACGAEFVAIYNDFCYSDSDINQRICASMSEVVQELELDPGIIRNTFGTYEKPVSTAYGGAAVGIVRKGQFKICTSQKDDLVCVLGQPSTRMDLSTQVTPREVQLLRKQSFVHEILPCGSHGFRKEANDLAQSCGLRLIEDTAHFLYSEGEESCGASGVVIVTVAPKDLGRLVGMKLPRPITVIGHLEGEGRTSPYASLGSEVKADLSQDGTICFSNGKQLCSVQKVSYGTGNLEDDLPGDPAETVLKLVQSAMEQLNEKGAYPVLLVDDLNFAFAGDGEKAISVLRSFCANRDIDPDTMLTGSTEDNHKATQSGYAVRVFGFLE